MLLALLVSLILTKPGQGQAYALAYASGALPRPGRFLELFSKVFLVFEKGLEEAVKEVQEIGKELTTKVKSALDTVDKYSKENGDFKKKYEDLDKGVQDLQAKHEKAQKDLEEIAKKMSSADLNAKGMNVKTFGDHLEEGLVKHKDRLIKLRDENDGSKITFNTKAVGTITMANYTGGTMGLTEWDSELARPERRTPQMRQLVRVLTTSAMFVQWAERAGFGEGGADTVAETVRKPQKDIDFTEAGKKVEKIAVIYKASKESLADIPGMRAEINSDGVDEVNLKLDEQILKGNGVSPNLSGIMGYAPTFTVPAGFVDTVPLASNYDAIYTIATVIRTSSFITPNIAVINDLDYARMMMLKDPTTGVYLAPPSFAVGDRIGSVRVVPDPSMPEGQFLVGDFGRVILRIREELGVQIGYENDDFTRNLVTILMEMRAVQYIKSQHIGGFRKGSLADVRAFLNPAVANPA